ncbi:MAG: N-6 DNA methylase [Spirosomataceae bacterium]
MRLLINRKNRDFSDEDINLKTSTYYNWRNPDGNYEDVAGFCKAETMEETAKLNYVLTLGRYVGLADEEDDFDFAERFTSLKTELEKQIAEKADLNNKIAENLAPIKLTPTI